MKQKSNMDLMLTLPDSHNYTANSFRNTLTTSSRETIYKKHDRYGEKKQSSRNVNLAPLQTHAHSSFMGRTTMEWATSKEDNIRPQVKRKLTERPSPGNIVFDMTI